MAEGRVSTAGRPKKYDEVHLIKLHQTDEEAKENTKPIGDAKNDHLFATVKSALRGMVDNRMEEQEKNRKETEDRFERL